jgi:hypothetical protein
MELPDLKNPLRRLVELTGTPFHEYKDMSPTALMIGSENPKKMIFYHKGGTRFVFDGGDAIALTPRRDYQDPIEIRKMTADEKKHMISAIAAEIKNHPSRSEDFLDALPPEAAKKVLK